MKKSFTDIHAVSPSIFGGEIKNQDRILYDPQTCTAAVCDGTTSSPYAEKAASIVSRCTPLILNKKVEKNLETVCDLLIAHRDLAIRKGVKSSDSIPESMREIVEEAAKANLSKSFQTTLVCAGFNYRGSHILVKVLNCGDSGFFAFSSDGQVLLSNLSNIDEKLSDSGDNGHYKICFSQGTELLTKIIGPLSEFPELAENKRNINPENWMVCSALCLCKKSDSLSEPANKSAFWLKQNELLLAPKHLLSIPKDATYKEFRRLFYSRFIRRTSSSVKPSADIQFDTQGNTTAVLPDHYYTGQWEYFEERFALDTHFLICSDGFYRAFSNAGKIWDWLNTNEKDLKNRRQKKLLLNQLHQQLDQTCGDDDISFIWIKPENRKGII